MSAPPITERHKPHFHRNAPWKEPVRAASTANGTLASAFENGDTLDGVTLATGDRILLKNQSAGAENGIYVVAASGAPARAYDLDVDAIPGFLVYVIAGTANAGKAYKNTNATAPTIGSTSLTFSEFGASSSIPAGTYELAIEGGQSVIFAHGSMGSTETLDPTDGNIHTGTLNANCAYTLNAPTGSGGCEIEFERTGSGGPWTETWPGSVTWLGGVAPTPPTSGNSAIVILRTLDGGTSWLGIPVGGSGGSALTIKDEGGALTTAATSLDFVGPLVTASGTGAAKTVTVTGALDDLTDVTITSAAAAQRLRYNGSAWVNSDLIWRPAMVLDPISGNYLPVTSGGDAVMVEA